MEPWQQLDTADAGEAGRRLHTCCGSTKWVERMLARRPFSSRDALLTAAREEWFALDRTAWLEAFACHPKIGDREALRTRFDATGRLAAREQAGVNSASDDVLDALKAANDEYERRFGYIFIVCATGKRADEMLGLLCGRLANDPAVELEIAASEQSKITQIRLENL